MALDIWATGLILWEAFSGKPLAKHPIHLTVGNVLNIEPVKIVELIGEVLSNKKKKGNLYNMRYSEPKEKTSLAHLVWCCTRADPSQRPCISEVIERYEAWVNYTETKMNARKIQSIRETFEDAVS